MTDGPARPVSLGAIAATFGRISATSFGGGQMSAIRREVVRSRRWVAEDEFLELLALGQLLPGANPVNVAVLVGSRLRGLVGAVTALAAAVLPGFAILLALGAFALDAHVPWTRGALRGCAAVAAGATLANAVDLSRKRLGWLDAAIVVAVALTVLVAHAPLALTLAVWIPVALALTRPKAAA